MNCEKHPNIPLVKVGDEDDLVTERCVLCDMDSLSS